MKSYLSKQNVLYSVAALASVALLLKLRNKTLSCSSCQSK